jgi:hypothetical protein
MCVLLLKAAVISLSGLPIAIISVITADAQRHFRGGSTSLTAQMELGWKIMIGFSAAMLVAIVPIIVFADFLGEPKRRINWKLFSANVKCLGWRELKRPFTLWKIVENSRGQDLVG